MNKIFMLIALLTTLLFSSSTDKPFNTKARYFLTYDKSTTCLVRHIKVYKAPKWVSKIETRNGKTIYFSSPKSMFEFYFRPGKWYDVGVRSERDFSKIVVTDYNSLKAINAESSFFVYGSRITSPAGDNLVAFETKEKADLFAHRFNGKRVMSFDNVSDALIRLLNGRI